MASADGQNKPSSEYLNDLFERVEKIRQRKKDCGTEEGAVFAEAKAKGYDVATLKRLLKLRAMKPSDRDDQDALTDIYMDVTGMARQPSLFRAAGLMTVDVAAREQVLDAFRNFVPDKGDVIIRFEGAPVRLWRNANGDVQIEDWKEPSGFEPSTGGLKSRPPAQPIPDVDDAGARQLGEQAFRDDRPVTSNPFPANDGRRREWDRGWRDASGGDGMGPAPKKGGKKS